MRIRFGQSLRAIHPFKQLLLNIRLSSQYGKDDLSKLYDKLKKIALPQNILKNLLLLQITHAASFYNFFRLLLKVDHLSGFERHSVCIKKMQFSLSFYYPLNLIIFQISGSEQEDDLASSPVHTNSLSKTLRMKKQVPANIGKFGTHFFYWYFFLFLWYNDMQIKS